MGAEVNMASLRELGQTLKQLPKEISGKGGGPLRKALAEAAKVIHAEAQALAPEDTGLLKREIRMVRAKNPAATGATEHYVVGVRRGKRKKYANTRENRRARRVGKTYQDESRAYYWRFIEFGTERQPARPFLRPAFESKKREALNRFETSLREGVQAAVRKVAKTRSRP
jgi:HK97 gp10 family phage protein